MTLQQRERIGSIIRSVVVIAIALICAVPLYVIVSFRVTCVSLCAGVTVTL